MPPCQPGAWAAGFNHPTTTNDPPGWPSTFEAINMAVIPNQPDPGKVIVWELNSTQSGNGQWTQRFAVGSPETGAFDNYVVTLPAGFGDLFCSGHVWLPDGRLFVAGGNRKYGIQGTTNNFLGSRIVAIWDPLLVGGGSNHGWQFFTQQGFCLRVDRWYPTVTLMGNNRVMVSGGTTDTAFDGMGCVNRTIQDPAYNTYEVWDIIAGSFESDPNNPTQNMLYPGPLQPPLDPNQSNQGCFSVLSEYPRKHLISSGQVVVAGMFRGSNRVHHFAAPGFWMPSPIDTGSFRHYGSSVLVPNLGNVPARRDFVMILGGASGGVTLAGVREINAFGGTSWSSLPSLNYGRMVANTVLLPDGAILVLGGSATDYFAAPAANAVPVVIPEIYRRSLNTWVAQTPQVSPRMYHSTAALLPSGKVVSAGGDIRSSDYEIFTPDYLLCGATRPAFAGATPSVMNFGGVYTIGHATLPAGVSIARVVLMRPCSVTHHSDMDQRYVELALVPPPPGVFPIEDTVLVQAPAMPNHTGTAQGSIQAPPGFYMVFLISSLGTPSVARWVWLQ
ncbi:MAG: DUF1929 domain-containing protein [Planctomycetes bacterium]|nr:DUF1929 domain-containing protein [Planctomycetota bacterium]